MKLLVTILCILAFLFGAPVYAQLPAASPEKTKQVEPG